MMEWFILALKWGFALSLVLVLLLASDLAFDWWKNCKLRRGKYNDLG